MMRCVKYKHTVRPMNANALSTRTLAWILIFCLLPIGPARPVAHAQDTAHPGCSIDQRDANTPALAVNTRRGETGEEIWVVNAVSTSSRLELTSVPPAARASHHLSAVSAACSDSRSRYRGCAQMRADGSDLILEFYNSGDSFVPGRRELRYALTPAEVECLAGLNTEDVRSGTSRSSERARVDTTTAVNQEVERVRNAMRSICPSGDMPCIAAGPHEMNFSMILPGTFQMGSPPDELGRQSEGETLHTVTLTSGFEMMTTEVTNQQWANVMGGPVLPPYAHYHFSNSPKVRISYDDVQNFIARLNRQEAASGYTYRLPTEAEWEYAARAGTQTAYSFGESPDALGSYAFYNCRGECRNLFRNSFAVGSRLANPWGLHDMHGNVWEWVSGNYTEYGSAPRVDPTGVARGASHVFRGGSVFEDWDSQRSARRWAANRSHRGQNVGFRLVRNVSRIPRSPSTTKPPGTPRPSRLDEHPWCDILGNVCRD